MTVNPVDNIALVARRLYEAGVNDVVFVGGAVIGLLLSDEAAPDVRPTLDVDVVTAAETRSAYYKVEERLRAAGFTQPIGEDVPVCRWIVDGVPVDVMPPDETILGLSNRWYRTVFNHSSEIVLSNGIQVRVANAPYVVAMKLEAFNGRGDNDFRYSHDLEDLMLLVDGRPELVSEMTLAPIDLRHYVAREFSRLLRSQDFLDSVPGYLDPDNASQARAPMIIERMERIRDLA